MKTEKVVWGLILVFIGSVFLLNNFGVIDFYWGSIWRFWPLIFILIGANMLFSRLDNNIGIILTAALTIIALTFIVYEGSKPGNERGRGFHFNFHDDDKKADKSEEKWSATNTFTEAFAPNTQRAELNIKGGATSYEIEDTTSNLFDADVKQHFGSYTLEKVSHDSIEVLTFRMRDKNQKWNMDEDIDGNEAKIRLNNKPLWDINVEMGAGKTDFDLTSFKVQNLKLKGGAASFEVKLGEPQTVSNVTVETGVAEVNIKIPSSSGCCINVDSGLSSKDFEGFVKQSDGTYTTNNFNTAAKKINIILKGGLSQFEVSRY